MSNITMNPIISIFNKKGYQVATSNNGDYLNDRVFVYSPAYIQFVPVCRTNDSDDPRGRFLFVDDGAGGPFGKILTNINNKSFENMSIASSDLKYQWYYSAEAIRTGDCTVYTVFINCRDCEKRPEYTNPYVYIEDLRNVFKHIYDSLVYAVSPNPNFTVKLKSDIVIETNTEDTN